MSELSRRTFLAGAAGAAAVGVVGCSGNDSTGGRAGATGPVASGARTGTSVASAPLPDPGSAPFDTVVVLMMENRSFDSMLGWLAGADGKQAGLSFADNNGVMHPTWRIAAAEQGCEFQDPFHTWQAAVAHYNDGALDGWLKVHPVTDQFPIAYYDRGDLSIMTALAEYYTTYDNYFCSMMGPTWPNRLYQLCATTDLDYTGVYPETDPGPGALMPSASAERPVKLDLAIFDRLAAAGLSATYYTNGEPMTGLFASKKYDSLTVHYEQFASDAKAGKLSNVVFVDPDYTGHSEFNGTSNDFHPYGSPLLAEKFVADVHDAVTTSPQFERTVMFLNFDEEGGFFDHVPPVAADDDTVFPTPGNHPDLKRTGFRVPAIAISPFSQQKVDHGGPYEHCSILKMIEWRWNLQPMTKRDANAKNIAESLDFTARRSPLKLPAFDPPPAQTCNNPNHLP